DWVRAREEPAAGRPRVRGPGRRAPSALAPAGHRRQRALAPARALSPAERPRAGARPAALIGWRRATLDLRSPARGAARAGDQSRLWPRRSPGSGRPLSPVEPAT